MDTADSAEPVPEARPTTTAGAAVLLSAPGQHQLFRRSCWSPSCQPCCSKLSCHTAAPTPGFVTACPACPCGSPACADRPGRLPSSLRGRRGPASPALRPSLPLSHFCFLTQHGRNGKTALLIACFNQRCGTCSSVKGKSGTMPCDIMPHVVPSRFSQEEGRSRQRLHTPIPSPMEALHEGQKERAPRAASTSSITRAEPERQPCSPSWPRAKAVLLRLCPSYPPASTQAH